jgi:hypothetical protein
MDWYGESSPASPLVYNCHSDVRSNRLIIETADPQEHHSRGYLFQASIPLPNNFTRIPLGAPSNILRLIASPAFRLPAEIYYNDPSQSSGLFLSGTIMWACK